MKKEIVLKTNRKRSFGFIVTIILVSFLVIPAYFFMDKNTTIAYVTVDVNPSVKFAVNDNFEVEKVIPLNEDAEQLLNSLPHFKGQSIENSIAAFMRECERTKRINDEKEMLIGISYMKKNKDEQIFNIEDIKKQMNSKQAWNITVIDIPNELNEKAKRSNSPINELLTLEMEKDTGTVDIKNKFSEEEKEVINQFYHHTNNRN